MPGATRDAGRKPMVIFHARCEPIYILLRETIQARRLGRLVGVHGTCNWWRAQSYFTSPGMWKGTWKLDGGGSLANQGVHTVDLLQWLGGPVVEVYGKFGCFAHDIETEDKTVSILTFANGALGSLTTTTADYPGLDRTGWVHGTRGSVVLEGDKATTRRLEGVGEKEREQQMVARYGRRGQQRA